MPDRVRHLGKALSFTKPSWFLSNLTLGRKNSASSHWGSLEHPFSRTFDRSLSCLRSVSPPSSSPRTSLHPEHSNGVWGEASLCETQRVLLWKAAPRCWTFSPATGFSTRTHLRLLLATYQLCMVGFLSHLRLLSWGRDGRPWET